MDQYKDELTAKSPLSLKDLKNLNKLLKELKNFEYRLQCVDKIWDLIIPIQSKWHHVRVTKYKDTTYVAHLDGNLNTLEVASQKKVQEVPAFTSALFGKKPSITWGQLLSYACQWIDIVKKDWVKANKLAHASYPLNRRWGILPNTIVQELCSDFYRIDKELGKVKTKKFLSLVEEGYFFDREKTTRKSMCAKDYFEYCRIAYLSSMKKEELDLHLSGKEMYKRYADGRHEGLLEIDEHSIQEFSEWLDEKHPKRNRGGHPWEIRRGGNTTHIDLFVTRPNFYTKEGFSVKIQGSSIGRIKEAICMFLGIYNAGLPISIEDPEGIRKRLLAQDNIGIVPSFDSLHRANQRFPECQDVYDVLHYDDLGKNKSRAKSFITWEPLPILRPCSL